MEPESPAKLRRQPKQARGHARIEKILDAAATVFDEVGYDAATTHLIAAKAGTAIGSLYQFFPDKAAIFHAMELRHVERVKAFWAEMDLAQLVQLPLQVMIHQLVLGVAELFEQPVSRVVFVQFFVARQIFHAIDDRMTQEAIHFTAHIFQQRNRALSSAHCNLLAEVCVHSSNAVILAALRNPDLAHRQHLQQQIENLMVAYLEADLGDFVLAHAGAGAIAAAYFSSKNVMKVMKCPHCRSQQLSKNGLRRGKQCYLCKSCGKQFVEKRDRPPSEDT
jgi:AcrR family transcriptional regulator